jgi:hypothetical protein
LKKTRPIEIRIEGRISENGTAWTIERIVTMRPRSPPLAGASATYD